MNLVIVESPTKARKIGSFLGNGYKVLSSFGHVRDLPKSNLGVDTEHDFEPKYVIPVKAKKVILELNEAVEKSDEIILATDEDREGEAIAWHLVQALGLNGSESKKARNIGASNKNKPTQRIVFHEITKSAIAEALKNPRDIDRNLVDAQQARRVLDRLVGYELSPFLWKKIRAGLSAGRVQSVAVKIIVDREREIQKFVKVEYWTVEVDLSKQKDSKIFRARLIKIDGKDLDKLEIKNETEAKKITESLNGAQYKVTDIAKKEAQRHPAPPFTTSTLQQEASRKLGLSAKQTMMLAQQLYENGHITYMRTDSFNLAQSALFQARDVIARIFGKEYTLDKPRFYATKSKGAQEAHEAIRPTDLSKTTETLAGELERSQLRLYDLIWKRTLACQMPPAIFDQTVADISAGNKYVFRANGQTMKFDGFIRAYTEGKDENGDDEELAEGELPELKVDEILKLLELHKLQHFTEPPPRFTDATLIKMLEAHGVGRPSTYAPTLTTIQTRGYVEKIEKKYHPTEIGFLVNDMLVENFPEIIDINFTSHIEEEFDEIAEGKIKWVPVIREFYTPFKKHLDEKNVSVEKLTEQSDIPCPHCGKKMLIKFGRNGKFLCCPEPSSKVTLPMPEEQEKIRQLEEKTAGEKCPICGGPMAVKRGRFGYFLGCVRYPECKGIAKILNKTGFKCPKCKEGDVVERKSRGRGKVFYGCSRYPDCDFITNKKPESEAELQEVLRK
jgi:DNA topoisomerase-1